MWHGQKDLNPRPTVLETVALPAELCPCVVWYRKVKHPTSGEMLTFPYSIVIVEKFLYASVTCINAFKRTILGCQVKTIHVEMLMLLQHPRRDVATT